MYYYFVYQTLLSEHFISKSQTKINATIPSKQPHLYISKYLGIMPYRSQHTGRNIEQSEYIY